MERFLTIYGILLLKNTGQNGPLQTQLGRAFVTPFKIELNWRKTDAAKSMFYLAEIWPGITKKVPTFILHFELYTSYIPMDTVKKGIHTQRNFGGMESSVGNCFLLMAKEIILPEILKPIFAAQTNLKNGVVMCIHIFAMFSRKNLSENIQNCVTMDLFVGSKRGVKNRQYGSLWKLFVSWGKQCKKSMQNSLCSWIIYRVFHSGW